MTGVYEVGDTGPSGHGQVFRGHVQHLLDTDFDLTVRTHPWGWNREGIYFESASSRFTDKRFREEVMLSDRFNDDYRVQSKQEAIDREDDLLDNMGTAETARSHDCIIREVDSDDDMDIWHTVGAMGFAEHAPDDPGVYTIVETDWNLDIIPENWVPWAREVDEVWVPNQWVYDAFERRGHTENVEIVPYGVDFSYRPTDYDCHACPAEMHSKPVAGGSCLADDTFTFGAVARWYHMKGVDALIEAYLREFSADEDVRLFLKTTMNNQAPIHGGVVQRVLSEAVDAMGIDDTPEVGVRTEPMGDQAFMDLMGVFDGFVMPSRGECVGIAWVQAMHAGTPVIATDWSAMNQYLTDDHALLVSEGEVEQPRQYQPSVTYAGQNDYPSDSNWFDPDIDALRDAMRTMYEMDEDERDAMAERAKDHVHDLFDWEKHGKTRADRLREVAE